MRTIFGVIADEDCTLTLTGTPKYTNAPVYVGYNSPFAWSEVEAGTSTWEIPLEKGVNYIIRLEDDEADGAVEIEADEDLTIVTIPETGTPVPKPGALAKNTATETGNPKDPWPPPLSLVTLGSGTIGWFDDRLSSYYSLSRSEGRSEGGRPANDAAATAPANDAAATASTEDAA